jgi:DNA-binding winged helix-turn-helix (wHTH) protein/TolB-like protein
MAEPRTKQERYRFGAFEFDADSLELRKQERVLRMRPQALKLLRVLLSRAGELVSREEIQRELWGGETFIDFEHGVNHGIKQLRAALGDNAEAPQYIQTLPRRGYRFIATVELAIPAVAVAVGGTPAVAVAPSDVGVHVVPAQRGRWAAIVIGVVITLAALVGWQMWRRPPRVHSSTDSSVAVLPFATSDLSADIAYAGASLADAVTTRLGLAGNVRVRPASVAAAYGRRTADAQEVGRALGVNYVLTGTLRRDGKVYRVESELVHIGPSASPPIAVGASAEDLLSLEAQLVEQLFTHLSGERPRGSAEPQTQNLTAYEAYLEGRFHLSRATARDTETAVALFERALASDEGYALAHAGLARAAAQMYIRFSPEESVALWKTRAEREATRALALNDRLAEAHEALAAVARFTDFDWNAVIRHSMTALRLNADLDLPHYYVASALQHVGRLDLVEREVAAGLEANPLNLTDAFRLRGVNALWGSKFDLSRSYLQRVRELSDRPISDPHLAQAIYYAGQPLVAEAMLAELTGSAQVEQRGDALRAGFMAARGERRESLTLVQRVQSRPYRDHHVAYSLGAAYAGLGNNDEAMRWLQQAAQSGFSVPAVVRKRSAVDTASQPAGVPDAAGRDHAEVGPSDRSVPRFRRSVRARS